jgi:hypothetical protein
LLEKTSIVVVLSAVRAARVQVSFNQVSCTNAAVSFAAMPCDPAVYSRVESLLDASARGSRTTQPLVCRLTFANCRLPYRRVVSVALSRASDPDSLFKPGMVSNRRIDNRQYGNAEDTQSDSLSL